MSSPKQIIKRCFIGDLDIYVYNPFEKGEILYIEILNRITFNLTWFSVYSLIDADKILKSLKKYEKQI